MTLAICPSTLDTDALGEEIAVLAARLHAATYELLVLLREFDAREAWGAGFASCAHWLHWRTGIDLGAAREKVRVARALGSLPHISLAMRRGQLSYAKVRALTRMARPDNEVELLEFALVGTAAHVERVARAWRRADAEASKDAERRHLSRTLSTWVDDDGMVVIRGRLAPEVGAVVMRALDAAADRLRRDSQGTTAMTISDELGPAQRRADALGLLAETALSADLDAGTAGDRCEVIVHVDGSDWATRFRGNASRALGRAAIGQDAAAGGAAGGGAAREAVADVAPGEGPSTEPSTGASLEVGDTAVHVSAETYRRLGCDCGVVVMTEDASGTALDVGRKRRSIPPALRRALAARDRGCRYPGCTARRCDAHHVEHWVDGGATRLDNLVLLCRRHHRLVHEGGVVLHVAADGHLHFTHRNRVRIEAAPPLPPVLAARLDDVLVAGTPPVWDGTPLDLPWVMDTLYSPA